MDLKKFLPRASALLLSGLLLLPAAQAARYTDLTPDHWAYWEMDRAVDLGILNGMGDGTMRPDDTLTWGQFLVMLARTFHPDTYAAVQAAGAAWDQAGYWAAQDTGLLLEEDFLPVDPANLSAPILRQDAAVLLARVLPEKAKDQPSWGYGSSADSALVDWATLDGAHQEAVSLLYDLYVVRGREEMTPEGDFLYYFDGGETIRRADGSILLLRTLDKVDQLHRGEEVTVTLHIVDPQGNALGPDQVVDTTVGTWIGNIVDANLLWHYTLAREAGSVQFNQDEYTLVYRPYTWAEAAEEDFWDKVEAGEANAEDYWLQDFWLRFQGENERKHQLLFGDPDLRRYANKEEAAAHATTVTVPVWNLDRSRNKVPSSATFSINAAIADDVTAIFTEIYNDPEQFPICDLGGYSWRGDSATGEHNCGTAIDINADQNYQVRDGQAMAGSHWTPGDDPYSISADGSVVRIFADHGWSWGGDAWAWDTDPTTGYHDYMHFSYMGG